MLAMITPLCSGYKNSVATTPGTLCLPGLYTTPAFPRAPCRMRSAEQQETVQATQRAASQIAPSVGIQEKLHTCGEHRLVVYHSSVQTLLLAMLFAWHRADASFLGGSRSSQPRLVMVLLPAFAMLYPPGASAHW